jgi:hypothetical protein
MTPFRTVTAARGRRHRVPERVAVVDGDDRGSTDLCSQRLCRRIATVDVKDLAGDLGIHSDSPPDVLDGQ